jgi:hypothetical protein
MSFLKIANIFANFSGEKALKILHDIDPGQFLRILGTVFIISYTFPRIMMAVLPLALIVVWILKVLPIL